MASSVQCGDRAASDEEEMEIMIRNSDFPFWFMCSYSNCKACPLFGLMVVDCSHYPQTH